MKALGIEFGSTRIKLVLINDKNEIISSGSFVWTNKLIRDTIWTYDLKDAIYGLQTAYRELKNNYFKLFGEKLVNIDSIGVSGMMHGYLVFDKDFKQLAEFRTWRNTITSEASDILTNAFNFPIPQRWSIAHIYQAMLNNEPEVKNIKYATTLAGYFHYLLSNRFCLGIGEASGVFPINIKTKQYDETMLAIFNELSSDKVPFKIEEVIPEVLMAGEVAGYLTEKGAALLDVDGDLKPGSLMVPPEGDMGTGMSATNSIKTYTGNVSIGTSSNLTIITGKRIKTSKEVDQILTPDGNYAALIHVNNGTSEINIFEKMLKEFLDSLCVEKEHDVIYEALFKSALNKNISLKDMVAVDYLSGEPITHIKNGQPLTIRKNGASYTLSTYMRLHIYSLLATIHIGLRQLEEEENIKAKILLGHGGFFKTKGVGNVLFASAINCQVQTFGSANEGGSFGMALLAKYGLEHNCSLADFLDKAFANSDRSIVSPDPFFKKEFEDFMVLYKQALKIERYSLDELKWVEKIC